MAWRATFDFTHRPEATPEDAIATLEAVFKKEDEELLKWHCPQYVDWSNDKWAENPRFRYMMVRFAGEWQGALKAAHQAGIPCHEGG